MCNGASWRMTCGCAVQCATQDPMSVLTSVVPSPASRSDMEESERAQVVEYETARLYGEGSGYDTLLADPGYEVSHFSVWYTPVADRSCESWCLVEEVELA